ncbi:hypothetical protein BD410DRAFT_795608 [Rickenella mellea]|uniref:Uncharacterized protein n=1 Tax=Rickenella mellea TaxID=50990 RepID=A0A4Y7PNZ2_9AGAM|nr:hypothetical protein BD410DRAFT_795608 [Rickenella mellea]
MTRRSRKTSSSLSSQPGPIQRAPVEILSNIFVHCLPVDRYAIPVNDRAPINVSSVCKQWREIAIRIPLLWCGIEIRGVYKALCPHILETWISRSKILGFSFQLLPGKYPRLEDEPPVDVALDVLIRHSPQWVSLEVCMSRARVARLMSVVPHHTPLLRELHLFDSDIPHPLHLDLSAPLKYLRHLSMNADATFNGGDMLLNLRTLSLSSVHSTVVVSSLAYCPRLEELVVHFNGAPHQHLATSIPPAANITLPCLRILKIRRESFDSETVERVIQLLDALLVPRLRSLSLLADSSDPTPQLWDSLLRFFQIQEFPLENFEIRNSLQFPTNISILLHHLPGLKYLGFDVQWVDQVVPAIFPDPQKGTRHCPKLRTVQLLWLNKCGQVGPLLSAIQPWLGAEDEPSMTTCQSAYVIVLLMNYYPLFDKLNACPGVEVITQQLWLQRQEHDFYTMLGSDACSSSRSLAKVY